MRGAINFRIDGERVLTPGIDYGPKGVVIVQRKGNRMLWKVPGHNTWAGNFQPWKWYGTVYMAAVDLGDGSAEILFEEQPGRAWKGTNIFASPAPMWEALRTGSAITAGGAK